VRAVGGEPGLDFSDIGAAAPVGRHEFDIELEFFRNASPEHRELPGLGQKHLVAG
jgi:hypothetical protein